MEGDFARSTFRFGDSSTRVDVLIAQSMVFWREEAQPTKKRCTKHEGKEVVK